MARWSQCLRELQGPLLPPKDLVETDDDCLLDDVEDDEDDSVFVDAEELCSGSVRAGRLPGRLRILIPDENTKEQCAVFGRFPITGPWWRVKVQVKPGGSRCYHVQGFPSYFLRSDMGPPCQKEICSLFLKECGVSDDDRKKFSLWVNKVSSFQDLSFENLGETLRTFYQESKRKDGKKSTQGEQKEWLPDREMSLPLQNPIPFQNAMTALKFPKIMEFLPRLLPRHFKWLLNSGSGKVLGKIEEILGTHPWKLGFRAITCRELKLLRCEASWAAFCQCPSLLTLMADLEKNALVMYSTLKQLCREHGHTYVEVADLTEILSEHMSFQDAWESLKFLRDIGVVVCEKACVFLHELYQAERGIATSICNLMFRPPWRLGVDVKKVLASIHSAQAGDARPADALSESTPDEARPESPGGLADSQDGGDHVWNNGEHETNAEVGEVQLDQDQVAALEMICSNAVTVVSGKGGCGKTTIVSHLFKHMEWLEEREVKKACEDFEQDQDVPEEWVTYSQQSQQQADKAIEVLLTAPTGKAAGLLRRKTGLHAYTLCQVNYSFYLWRSKMVNKPWRFSSVSVLVVDEGSLVSVGIFKSVLNLLCEHSKLKKLIILGDIRQLPSIEPGNLLKDLFETLKSRNCAIELKTNHRAESQLIVDNATRISGRQFPEFDAELNISDNPTFPISIQDKTFIFVRLPEEDASSQSSKSNHRSYLYSAVKTLLQENDLKDAKTSQFIAFRRQDCDLVNDCCCRHYTGHLTRDHQKRLIFGTGDKICCTKNAYLSELLPGDTSDSEQSSDLDAGDKDFGGAPRNLSKNKHDFESNIRLCNGEIFFITQDVTDVTCGIKRYLTISNMAGLEVTVDFKKLMRYCRIKHSWARTIHTFQGSEEHTVVYVVGKAGRQHWQHVYTAVTRGRCRVYVIAEESQLRSAVRKTSFPRKTRLKHFLQNSLSLSCAPPAGDGGEPSMPPASPPSLATAETAACDVPRSEGSAAVDGTLTSMESWRLLSFDGVDADEDALATRGVKRTGEVSDDGSPSKVLMVGQSPQVSSRLQNLRLNNLVPRELFKPTNNEET
ncbi:DNA helicase B isoform X2 [Otolemur garnettii]|uniref:DNA helicase B isoform X2 n=1 Tax=Otolemur garnettii TaxID=30611 RepID=UPI0002741D7D|nr:DNA helicase B isoform X2 [Otolemur garnettii]